MSKTISRKALQELLIQPKQAAIYRLAHEQRQKVLEKAAAGLGFACFKVDFGEAEETGAILDVLGRELSFPPWYGNNLDALYDCLSDFSWRQAPGYAIFISGAGALLANHACFTVLNDVFAAAIAQWQRQHIPLWIFYAAASPLPDDAPDSLPTLK